jgi:hypothetical protein
MGGRDRGFDSHQLNCVSSFLFFYFFLFFIFLSSYLLIFSFSSLHLCIFPRSSYHISIFHIRIFEYSHIRMFSKMQCAWTGCIPSGRCFIKQKGYEVIQAFLNWISVDRLGCDVMWYDAMWWVAWVSGVAGSVHIKSTVFVWFLISYFHVFIFHPIIFLYFIFTYSHIRMFSKMQCAWTVCIPSGRCFIEQKVYELIQVFLS